MNDVVDLSFGGDVSVEWLLIGAVGVAAALTIAFLISRNKTRRG